MKLYTNQTITRDPLLTNLDMNDEFKSAFDLMENTKECLFITGKAGTGKSTLLMQIAYQLAAGENMKVLYVNGEEEASLAYAAAITDGLVQRSIRRATSSTAWRAR